MLAVPREKEKSHVNFQGLVHSQCRVFFFAVKLAPEVMRMPNNIFYHSGNHCLCMENKFRDHEFSVNV